MYDSCLVPNLLRGKLTLNPSEEPTAFKPYVKLVILRPNEVLQHLKLHTAESYDHYRELNQTFIVQLAN